MQRRFGEMASVFVVYFVRWRQLSWVSKPQAVGARRNCGSSGPVMAGESESDKTTRSGNSGLRRCLHASSAFGPKIWGFIGQYGPLLEGSPVVMIGPVRIVRKVMDGAVCRNQNRRCLGPRFGRTRHGGGAKPTSLLSPCPRVFLRLLEPSTVHYCRRTPAGKVQPLERKGTSRQDAGGTFGK